MEKKVFISYSHDSPEHVDRVLALADRLVGDGVDCILDQCSISPHDFPRNQEWRLACSCNRKLLSLTTLLLKKCSELFICFSNSQIQWSLSSFVLSTNIGSVAYEDLCCLQGRRHM